MKSAHIHFIRLFKTFFALTYIISQLNELFLELTWQLKCPDDLVEAANGHQLILVQFLTLRLIIPVLFQFCL